MLVTSTFACPHVTQVNDAAATAAATGSYHPHASICSLSSLAAGGVMSSAR